MRAFNGMVPISWVSSNTLRFQDYMEVWYSSLDELTFMLIDPAQNESATVSRNNPEVRQALGGNLCHLKLTELHPDNGDTRLVVTIIPQAGAIQTGIWTLRVVGMNIRSRNGNVDIWVERDETRAIRYENEEPQMTLSVPGTADTVVTVGACRASSPLQLTDSSSFGLTRDGRPKPDVRAPGFQIVAARANSGSQDVVPMTGTSMAAPHVTGALALVLSRRHKHPTPGAPQYNARQLRAALLRTVKNFSNLHHEGFGFGMLDAAKLFQSMA